jgi:hypothetical protein
MFRPGRSRKPCTRHAAQSAHDAAAGTVTDMSLRATPNEAVPAADETIASIIPLHQPKKAKTSAQRARAYRQRKRQKAKAVASPNDESAHSDSQGIASADLTLAEPPAPSSTVTLRGVTRDVDAPSRSISRILLLAAALALAGVGIVMNGWFARSLGSSDIAGWLFLAIGVAADLIALVMPSCAARL